MDRGDSLQVLAEGFIGSEEFAETYGTLSADGFIIALYGNVLDREPDQGGRDYWINVLSGDDGIAARANVLAQFSESKENVGNLAELIANGIAFIPYA